MYNCKYCNKEFENKNVYAGHTSRCMLNFLQVKEYKFNCEICNKEFVLNLTEPKFLKKQYSRFCSRSCACTQIHSVTTKSKISSGLEKYYEDIRKKRVCSVCKKEYHYKRKTETTKAFCSKECQIEYHSNVSKYRVISDEFRLKMSEIGKKSAKIQSESRRSKNEAYFCLLCENHFKNVTHNETIFNGWDADIIIHDIKYAVLWNGPWHYKKITKKHSVEQVQNRDRIKLKEIEKYGYNSYTIRDNGREDTVFVEAKFKEFLEYCSTLKN